MENNLTFIEKLELQKNLSTVTNEQKIKDLYDKKISFYLWGAAGTGKTEKILNLAKGNGDIVKTMSVTPLSTKGEFYGFMSVDGSRYVSTPFREAYENGYTFLLDEMDNISQNLSVSLNQSLSQSVLTFPDKTVEKHSNFRFLGTGNTNGMGGNSSFSGRQKLDFSFKDRFIPIEWTFDNNLEYSLCKNGKWVSLVQAIRMAVQKNGIGIQCTMRSSIYGDKILESQKNIPILDLLEMTIFKYQLSTETRNKILNSCEMEIKNFLDENENEPKKEEIEETFSSQSETVETIEIKKVNKFNFTIGNPEKIQEYQSKGFSVCTIDKSQLQKKNNLLHFDGQITLEKLQSIGNENIVFVTHTTEKKELIKAQLKGLGLL